MFATETWVPQRSATPRYSYTYQTEASDLGDFSSSTSETDAVARHIAYLGRMATEGIVPHEVSGKARKLWEIVRKHRPGLPVPLAVTHEGGPIHYTWDDGQHVISLECLSGDQPCEWYASDRQSGHFDGGEFDLSSGVPDQVLKMFQDYLKHRPRNQTDGNW